MSDSDDLFAEVLIAMIEGRPPDAAAREWFVRQSLSAVRRSESLDVALGLAGPGLPKLQRRLLKLRRDAALRDALEAVSLDPHVTRWQRCVRLAPMARSFMADAWPKVKRLPRPAPEWPAWKQCLFLAAQTDLALPLTATGLRAAVQETGACSLKGGGAKILAQYL